MINYADELKSHISIENVVERYVTPLNREKRMPCFIHNGHDRNMLVKNGFAYCFVCGAKLDIFGTVQKLFNLDFMQACKKLNDDFCVGLPIGKKLTHAEVLELKRAERLRKIAKSEAETRKSLENKLYIKICDELHFTETYISVLEPQRPVNPDLIDKTINDEYFKQLKRYRWLEWLVNTLLGHANECEWTYTLGTDAERIYDKLISGELTI